jgi:hypothetical protein
MTPPSPYRAPVDVIRCPLCDVPHRSAATVCDSCHQPLHQPLDIDALRVEHAQRRRSAFLALGATAAMMVVNFTVLSRAGFGIILFAPLAWLVRARALGAMLRRLGA